MAPWRLGASQRSQNHGVTRFPRDSFRGFGGHAISPFRNRTFEVEKQTPFLRLRGKRFSKPCSFLYETCIFKPRGHILRNHTALREKSHVFEVLHNIRELWTGPASRGGWEGPRSGDKPPGFNFAPIFLWNLWNLKTTGKRPQK